MKHSFVFSAVKLKLQDSMKNLLNTLTLAAFISIDPLFYCSLAFVAVWAINNVVRCYNGGKYRTMKKSWEMSVDNFFDHLKNLGEE